METMFIRAKSKVSILKILHHIKMDEKIGIITTTQFIDEVNKIKWKNVIVGGQILGCDISNAEKIKNKVDAFLYIGDGEFHPKEVCSRTGKKVYVGNPYTNDFYTLYPEEFDHQKRRVKGAYLKYLHSKKIGFLVSTKAGQNNLKKALDFKLKNKKKYIFLFDTLDFNQLENFPDIEVWVNTACPRLGTEDYKKFNKPVINLRDLKESFK